MTTRLSFLEGLRKRLKLEVTDGQGDKLTLILEGRLTREKIIQLADLIDVYGGGLDREEAVQLEGSKLSRVMAVVEKHFPFSTFTSREVLEAYESEYREPVTLSTVSTYLSRLSNKGFLERVGLGSQVKYRLVRSEKRIEDELKVKSKG